MSRKLKQRHIEIGSDTELYGIDETNAKLGDLFVILYGIAERIGSDSNAPDFIKEIVNEQ